MFIILPLAWVIAWLLVAGVVAAFSGLGAHGAGLVLFIAIFGAGGLGVPVVALVGWMIGRRLRNR